MDKTFAAIEKLKEVELELHRLKNYAEMMNRSVEAKREWQSLTDEVIWLEYQQLWPFHPAEEPTLAKDIVKFASAIEAKLKEKNSAT